MSTPKIVRQRYPPIPKDAKQQDIVEEFFVYKDDDGVTQRGYIGRVYCPVLPIDYDDALFDAGSVDAARAKKKYAKQIKNRRRYDRDLRRKRQQGESTCSV